VIDFNGRGGGIRTPDPLLPKQMRYQTALRPDSKKLYREQLDQRMMQHPHGQPHESEHWNRNDRQKDKREAKQEDVILPGVHVRLAQMPRQQIVVATVGLPRDVKYIAEKRNRADPHIEREIHDHAHKRDVRHTAKPCSDDDDAGCESGKNISEKRDQPDDSLDSKADRRTRNAKAIIKHARQQIQIFVGEQSAADTRA
jgi:hypothetical protein